MTERSPSDDELLSSFIDGELTGDDATRLDGRLAAEPALRARLDDLRAAASLAATPVAPLDRATGDSLIAGALAASATSPAVTDLGAARATRQRRWGGRVAAVAATVLLVGVAIPVLSNVSDSDDDTAGDSGDASADMATDDAGADDGGGDDMADDDSFEALADDGADMAGSAEAADGQGGDAENATDTTDDSDTGADDGDDMGDDTADDTDAVAAAGGLTSFTAAFGLDALADELGSFAAEGDLLTAVADGYAVHRDDRDDGDTNDSPDDSAAIEVARTAVFAQLDIAGCSDEILELEESLRPVAADYATADVDGSPRAVLLYALEDDEAQAFVVDLDSCAVADVPLNGGG